MSLKEHITKLNCKLYYVEHKDEVNKNRKNYSRQTWDERTDNPKRPVYTFKKWCRHCGEWRSKKDYKCDECHFRLRITPKKNNKEVARY